MTTVKVTTEIRDKLKVLADAENISIGEEIMRLVLIAEREKRFDLLHQQIADTSPEDMADYLEETREWQDADLGDLRD